MNQYQIKHAAEKIEGYVVPRPGELTESAFGRAKEETIKAYESYIKAFKELSFEQFKGVFPRYHELPGRK